MGIIAKIAAGILAISLMTFVIFFGRLPVFRHTPIAWLHRFFAVQLPGGILALDRLATGGRFTTSLRRFGSFMVNDKHPTVLVFFVALLAGSEIMAIPAAWAYLGGGQRAALAVLVVLPFAFLYLAAFSDPGVVALGNLRQHLQRYPYDYALFHPGARCHTCNLLKPPRSKHCPICKRCVGRLDHHCIFINNCVGVGNHHWFLLLLLSTAVLASYGGLLALRVVADRTVERFPNWSLLPWRAFEYAAAGADGAGAALGAASANANATAAIIRRPMSSNLWLILLSWGVRNFITLSSVGLLGLLISPLIWGLLLYNLWNIWTGQTTNESLKWSDWKCDMEDGFVYRRRMNPDSAWRPGQPAAKGPPSESAPAAATATRWPVEADHVLWRSEDGSPPAPNDKALPGVGDWEKVWNLRDVDNLYDLGFWRNLKDIFSPDCQFNAPGLPSQERRGRPRKRQSRKS